MTVLMETYIQHQEKTVLTLVLVYVLYNGIWLLIMGIGTDCLFVKSYYLVSMYVHICTLNLKHEMQAYFNNIMLVQLEMGNLPGSHVNDNIICYRYKYIPQLYSSKYNMQGRLY